jgi:hypothetical protein
VEGAELRAVDAQPLKVRTNDLHGCCGSRGACELPEPGFHLDVGRNGSDRHGASLEISPVSFLPAVARYAVA